MVPGKPSVIFFFRLVIFFPIALPSARATWYHVIHIITAFPNLCKACDAAPTATAARHCYSIAGLWLLHPAASGGPALRFPPRAAPSPTNYLNVRFPWRQTQRQRSGCRILSGVFSKKSRERERQEGWAEKQLNHNPLRGSGARGERFNYPAGGKAWVLRGNSARHNTACTTEISPAPRVPEPEAATPGSEPRSCFP